MKKNLYDVYDLFGNKLINEKTASEISVALCVPANKVTKYCCEHKVLEKKYYIEKVSQIDTKKENSVCDLILVEWEKAVAPFKNIIWTNQYEPGVKRLVVRS